MYSWEWSSRGRIVHVGSFWEALGLLQNLVIIVSVGLQIGQC